ncbi:C80 family cysteine peptidase [Microcoleus sp. F8-D3]
MTKAVTIIAYLNDDVEQSRWLNSFLKQEESNVYIQTQKGKYKERNAVLSGKTCLPEELKDKDLKDILESVNEIRIVSHGRTDGSTIYFASQNNDNGGLEKTAQQMAEIIFSALDLKITYIKIIFDSCGSAVNIGGWSAVNIEGRDYEHPTNTFIENFAQEIYNLIRRNYQNHQETAFSYCHFKIEGRAGTAMTTNEKLYGKVTPYNYHLANEQLTKNLNFSNADKLVIHDILPKVCEILFWAEEESLTNKTKQAEIQKLVKKNQFKGRKKEDEAANIIQELAEDITREYKRKKYSLLPIITFDVSSSDVLDSTQVNFNWESNEKESNNSGALGHTAQDVALIQDIRDYCNKQKNTSIISRYLRNKNNNLQDDLRDNYLQDLQNKALSYGKPDTENQTLLQDIRDNMVDFCNEKLIHSIQYTIVDFIGRANVVINNDSSDYMRYNQTKDLFDLAEKTGLLTVTAEDKEGFCYALRKFFGLVEVGGWTVSGEKAIAAFTELMGNYIEIKALSWWSKKPPKDLLIETSIYIKLYYNAILKAFQNDSPNENNKEKPLLGGKNNLEKVIEKLRLVGEVQNVYDATISYVKEGVTSRHAVCIKKIGADCYKYFDPNTGVFNHLSEEQLKAVFQVSLNLVDKSDEAYIDTLDTFKKDNFFEKLNTTFQEYYETAKRLNNTIITSNYILKPKNLGGFVDKEPWNLPSGNELENLANKPAKEDKERKIIIQMQGDEDSFRAAQNLFSKDPKNTEWIQARNGFGGMAIKWSDEEKIFVVRKSLDIKAPSDLKIVLVGHGSTKNGYATLGGYNSDDIKTRLEEIFAGKDVGSNITGIKVSLVGCRLANGVLEKSLPQEVGEWLLNKGRELNITPENLELTAQRYDVRIRTDGRKEVLIDDSWVLAEAERLLGNYTKITLGVSDGKLVEKPHSFDSLMTMSGETVKALLQGELSNSRKKALEDLLSKIKKEVFTANKDDSTVLNHMNSAQKTLLHKAKIAELALKANESINKLKPPGEGWIADLQSAKLTDKGSSIKFIREYSPDGKAERSQAVETDSDIFVELQKHAQAAVDAMKDAFYLDPNTGNFSPKPGHDLVEGSNEVLNVYFTLKGLMGSGRDLINGNFNHLAIAMQVSLVSQMAQTGLGTADLIMKTITGAKLVTTEKILAATNKFSKFSVAIAPVFDIINLTILSIEISKAKTPEEKAEIITNLVLGSANSVLSVLGLATMIMSGLEIGADIASAISPVLGLAGLALIVFSQIASEIFNLVNITVNNKSHKKSLEATYAILYKQAKDVDDVQAGTTKLFLLENKSEVSSLKFLPSIVIEKIDFKDNICFLGDIYMDDMNPASGQSVWVKSKNNIELMISDGKLDFNASAWPRNVKQLSIYQGLKTEGEYTAKFGLPNGLDVSRTVYVLPGKASLTLHQEFGFSTYQYNPPQTHETAEQEQNYTPEVLENGKILINKLLKTYNERIKPNINFEHESQVSFMGFGPTIIKQQPEITGFAVEYHSTTIEVLLDNQSRTCIIQPDSVDDAKYLNYIFSGDGGSSFIILADRAVGINIKSSNVPEKLKNESWKFDLSRQIKSLDQLINIVLNEESIQIGDQIIKFDSREHGRCLFRVAFENQVFSEIIFELNDNKQCLILHKIQLNEDYIGSPSDRTIAAISSALSTLAKLFANTETLIFMYKDFLGCVYDSCKRLMVISEVRKWIDTDAVKSLGLLGNIMGITKRIDDDAVEHTEILDINTFDGKQVRVPGNVTFVVDKTTGTPKLIKKGTEPEFNWQSVNSIIDGILVPNIVNVKVTETGNWDRLIENLFNNPERIIEFLNLITSDNSIERMSSIQVNLTDSKEGHSSIIIDLKFKYESEYPTLYEGSPKVGIGYDIKSGYALEYGSNSEGSYCVTKKFNNIGGVIELIPIIIDINVKDKMAGESMYYKLINDVLSSDRPNFSKLLQAFNIYHGVVNKMSELLINFVTNSHNVTYKVVASWARRNTPYLNATYISKEFGDFDEYFYTYEMQSVYIMYSDVSVAPPFRGSHINVFARKDKNDRPSMVRIFDYNDQPSRVVIFDYYAQSLNLNIVCEEGSQVEILFRNTKKENINYYFSGLNLILVKNNFRSVTIVTIIDALSERDKRITITTENDDSIAGFDIWDIRSNLVEFVEVGGNQLP